MFRELGWELSRDWIGNLAYVTSIGDENYMCRITVVYYITKHFISVSLLVVNHRYRHLLLGTMWDGNEPFDYKLEFLNTSQRYLSYFMKLFGNNRTVKYNKNIINNIRNYRKSYGNLIVYIEPGELLIEINNSGIGGLEGV